MIRLRSATVLALFLLMPLALVSFGSPAAGATLVNINTADQATLETLPGIGPSKAIAIIDYRNANGSFATIEDIQNVSGIGPATFESIRSLITVSGSDIPETPDDPEGTPTDTTISTQSSTQTGSGSGKAAPKGPLTLSLGADRTVIVGAETSYDAQSFDGDGALYKDIHIAWSFGDGAAARGRTVLHTYYAPGDYAVIVHLKTRSGEETTASFIAHAIPLPLRIASVSATGVTVENTSKYLIDLSSWQIAGGGSAFVIPERTHILPGKTITFASQVTGLAQVSAASLLFPSGALATEGGSFFTELAVQETSDVQPVAPRPALSSVQRVEPTLPAVTGTNHATEAVQAPAAQASLAAAGAAVGEPATTSVFLQKKPLLFSPWTWSLTGLAALSAGAFVFF